MARRDETPLGDITGGALLAAAQSAADWLGVSLADLAEKGVDFLLDLIGITSCSDANKRKYRQAVANATLAELETWLRTKRVRSQRLDVNATGNCLKYALAEAARRAKREADGMGRKPTADDARRRLQGPYPSRSACFDALRVVRAEHSRAGFVWPQDLHIELNRRCRNFTNAIEQASDDSRCPPIPTELQLIGVGRDRWCTAESADFAPLIQAVREANLTAEERQRLLAAPYASRGAIFREIIEARDGGSDWLLWLVGILATLGLGALAVSLGGGK